MGISSDLLRYLESAGVRWELSENQAATGLSRKQTTSQSDALPKKQSV
jgi:hypothetical protein